MIKLCQKCPDGTNIPRLPLVRKCCFCIPVRKGVIIFGYVNIVFCLLSFPILIFLLVGELTSKNPDVAGHNYIMDPLIHLPLSITFSTIDVVMTVVLLIGAHKKKQMLLKAYLYFGVVFQIVILCIDFVYFNFREYIEITLYFIISGLNCYMLFLVYNIVRDIAESSEVQYVAHRDPHNL